MKTKAKAHYEFGLPVTIEAVIDTDFQTKTYVLDVKSAGIRFAVESGTGLKWVRSYGENRIKNRTAMRLTFETIVERAKNAFTFKNARKGSIENNLCTISFELDHTKDEIVCHLDNYEIKLNIDCRNEVVSIMSSDGYSSLDYGHFKRMISSLTEQSFLFARGEVISSDTMMLLAPKFQGKVSDAAGLKSFKKKFKKAQKKRRTKKTDYMKALQRLGASNVKPVDRSDGAKVLRAMNIIDNPRPANFWHSK